MENPKTIWLNKGSTFNNGNGGLWSMPDPVFSAQEMRDYGSVEYRLVESSNIDHVTMSDDFAKSINNRLIMLNSYSDRERLIGLICNDICSDCGDVVSGVCHCTNDE